MSNLVAHIPVDIHIIVFLIIVFFLSICVCRLVLTQHFHLTRLVCIQSGVWLC